MLLPAWQMFIAETVALTCAEIAKNVDVIVSAIRRANTAVAVDSQPDPVLKDAVLQNIKDAINSGFVPPAFKS